MFKNFNKKINLKKVEINIKILFLILLMGSIFGSFFTYYTNMINYQNLFNLKDNILNITSILEIFIKNLKYFVVIWFLGYINIGNLFIFLLIFVKGFNFGFTTASIFYQFGLKGFKYIFFGYLPQSFIYVPFIIYVSYKALKYIKQTKNKEYYSIFFTIIIFSIILSLLDIYLLKYISF